MTGLHLDWTPGKGGLVAELPTDVALPDLEPPADPDARPVQRLHVTLLARASMAPLVPVLGPSWARLRPTLPAIGLPRFVGPLRRATRAPHPTKDLPAVTRDRITWFITVQNPQPLRSALAALVRALDAESQSRGGPAFPHPEPDRFFHVSLYNNRGGDPHRSIGDIRADES